MAPRSISRRELLKTTGGLLVGFNLFEPFLGLLAQGTVTIRARTIQRMPLAETDRSLLEARGSR